MSIYIIYVSLICYLSSPTITIAQSIIESGANPNAIGKYGEKGAMQVIEKDWGKVPKHYGKQLQQGDKIRESLIKEYSSPRIGLKRYNGIGRAADKYASKVITKALELTLLGV